MCSGVYLCVCHSLSHDIKKLFWRRKNFRKRPLGRWNLSITHSLGLWKIKDLMCLLTEEQEGHSADVCLASNLKMFVAANFSLSDKNLNSDSTKWRRLKLSMVLTPVLLTFLLTTLLCDLGWVANYMSQCLALLTGKVPRPAAWNWCQD